MATEPSQMVTLVLTDLLADSANGQVADRNNMVANLATQDQARRGVRSRLFRGGEGENERQGRELRLSGRPLAPHHPVLVPLEHGM